MGADMAPFVQKCFFFVCSKIRFLGKHESGEGKIKPDFNMHWNVLYIDCIITFDK